MAVVMSGVASNGAKWRIHDDCYVNCTPEEIERRLRYASEVAYQALVQAMREKMAKEQKEKND